MKLKDTWLLGRKVVTNLDSILKKRHYFANKGLSSQSFDFSRSHVWMWELDCEESWAVKNCCFWTVVLEKTLESPLDCKEIQPVHPKGDQSRMFIQRTDVEAETPILWPPDAKHWLIWKYLMRGKIEAEGEGDNREWDGWMASPTQWTWIWVSSRSWWWTGRPGVLQSTRLQRVRHDWVTELNSTETHYGYCALYFYYYYISSISDHQALDLKRLGTPAPHQPSPWRWLSLKLLLGWG